MLRASSVKRKNLTLLRVNSAKNPSHSSERRLKILRRPDVSGLLRMTLLNAPGCNTKSPFRIKLNLVKEEALLEYSGRKGILL
jgi:hypothetical protein